MVAQTHLFSAPYEPEPFWGQFVPCCEDGDVAGASTALGKLAGLKRQEIDVLIDLFAPPSSNKVALRRRIKFIRRRSGRPKRQTPPFGNDDPFRLAVWLGDAAAAAVALNKSDHLNANHIELLSLAFLQTGEHGDSCPFKIKLIPLGRGRPREGNTRKLERQMHFSHALGQLMKRDGKPYKQALHILSQNGQSEGTVRRYAQAGNRKRLRLVR